MNNQPPTIAPRKKFLGLKIALGVLVLLLAAYGGYRYTLHRMVQAKLDAIRKAGYPVTLAELDKWYAWPPAGQNAADVYTNAFANLRDWATERKALLPIEGFTNLPPRTVPIPEDIQQVMAEYLADNAEALRLLHEAAGITECRYPLDLTKGFAVQLPALNKIRRSARVLALDTALQFENGRPDLAAESIAASLRLARSLAKEPVLISQLVRFACRQIALQSLEQALNRSAIPSEQLALLDDRLSEAGDEQCMTRAFVGERCYGSDTFRIQFPSFDPLKSPSDEQMMIASWVLGEKASDRQARVVGIILRAYRATGFVDVDHLIFLDVTTDFVDATQTPLPTRLTAVRSIGSRAEQTPRFALLSRLLVPALDGAIIKDAMGIAMIRAARTVLAVERHRLTTDKLPDTLVELVPAFLDAVHTDPFDGNPLRYRKLERGYVVYSIGEDGQDNGGTEKNSEGRQYRPGTDITFTVER